jgi:hypothetical protein
MPRSARYSESRRARAAGTRTCLMSGCQRTLSCDAADYPRDVRSHPLPTPPTMEELESWAGRGRVLRATESEVATWRLPQSAKAALISSGVPVLEGLVREVSFRATAMAYWLAVDSEDGSTQTSWQYGAVPETGEVRLWSADECGPSSFVNSSISQWLCSLHVVGSCFAESTTLNSWDESAEAEEQALAELADLLRRIKVIDPAAIADGDHGRQFWPGVLDRWLF